MIYDNRVYPSVDPFGTPLNDPFGVKPQRSAEHDYIRKLEEALKQAVLNRPIATPVVTKPQPLSAFDDCDLIFELLGRGYRIDRPKE